ncbi:SAM-dependent methyltransferase [Streptomyces sp. NPDC055078]
MLYHIAAELALKEGEVLADLGCGRGGPGLWPARAAHADLVGIDFSPVAVAQARQGAATYEMKGTAHFVVNDLTTTGLGVRVGMAQETGVAVRSFDCATRRCESVRR